MFLFFANFVSDICSIHLFVLKEKVTHKKSLNSVHSNMTHSDENGIFYIFLSHFSIDDGRYMQQKLSLK